MASESNDPLSGQKKDRDVAIPVQVQCDAFRCLAYRDEQGRWIDFHTGQPLKGKVQEMGYNGDDVGR